MAIKIVNEGGTAVATISYIDGTDTPMVPESSEWQLMKRDGTIINGRTFTAGSFTGTKVVMFGDDLMLDSTKDTVRIFALQGLYNSTLGSNLPFTEEIEFEIRNLYSQDEDV